MPSEAMTVDESNYSVLNTLLIAFIYLSYSRVYPEKLFIFTIGYFVLLSLTHSHIYSLIHCIKAISVTRGDK